MLLDLPSEAPLWSDKGRDKNRIPDTVLELLQIAL